MRALEEEVVNAYTHLISSILSAVFCAIFVARIPDTIHQLQIFLLGSASFWAFFSSFLYHNTKKPKLKQRNLVLDRVGIYIMISATGVSFALGLNDDYLKSLYCAMILCVSCFLVAKYCSKREENELYSIVSCLLFSILCIIPITGIFAESQLVNSDTIAALILSMVCYSAGVVFYTIDSKKWAHTAWHILVSTGYASCFAAHLIAAKPI
jgi:hemolysin III